MPPYAYILLLLGWLACFSAFVSRRPASAPAQVKTQARWGIILQLVAFSLLWQGHFWEHAPQPWRMILGIVLLMLAPLLSWGAVRALGSHWRLDAGLNADHQLIRSGPYAIVRHPIYTSLLCLLLGTGLIITPWLLFVGALLLFLVGTQIRVRIEDNLLSSRFGDEFEGYRKRVPAYIPWTRS